MDTTGHESVDQQVASEIADAQGALEADALEARVAASLLEPIQGVEVVPVVTPTPRPVLAPSPVPPPTPPPVPQAPVVVAQVNEPIKEVPPAVGQPEAKGGSGTSEATPPSKGEKKHELTTSAFKALKQKAEEKGRRTAMDEVQQALKDSGFTTLREAFDAIKKAGLTAAPAAPLAAPATPPAAPAVVATPLPPPAAPEAPRANQGALEAELRKAQRERERLAAELTAAKAANETEKKRRAQLTKKIDAMTVDQEIRETAIKQGVRDVDYAMTLLSRELETKSDEDLKTFSEAEYFKGLRDTHGHLYGEVIVAATTGAPAGHEPAPAPTVQKVQQQVANGAKPVDAMKTPLHEVYARLKQLGLTAPTS